MELLKTYSKEIIGGVIAASTAFAVPAFLGGYFEDDKFHIAAVINDPDGFSNVRSMPKVEGQIVTVVKEGDVFHTYHQDRNWWQVRTKDGKIGYVHTTRIQLQD